MTSTDLRQLEHRDPSCRAGFSVLLDSRVPAGDPADWDDRRPTAVVVRCWACDTEYELHAASRDLDRDDECEGDLRRADKGRRPYLWGGDYPNTLRTLPAAVPVERVGALELHAERRTGFGSLTSTEDVFEWLVSDHAGNVVGAVVRYRTARGATRYRCGLLEQGVLADGFQSTRAAVRRLALELSVPALVPA